MSVPIRFPVARPWVGAREVALVTHALETAQLSQGPQVLRFEADFAAALRTPCAVATMNGTVALHLVLAALGIGPGDEVIVPALTFVATANAVAYTGATPVLVDIDLLTWCLDARLVERAVTAQTRAVIPVHLYGQLADVPAIDAALSAAQGRLGSRTAIHIVEDAAQAFGSTLHAAPAGTLGTAGTFSFYANKTISTGEGGMVVMRSTALDAHCRRLRGQGMSESQRYYHPVRGFNYRMTELQGALGVAQVGDLAQHLAARRQVAREYRDALAGAAVEWQIPLAGSDPVVWLNTCLLPPDVPREAVAAALADCGIETRPTFVPLPQLPMYAATADAFPVATDVGARGISLPTYRGLTEAQVTEIADALWEVLA